MNCSQISTIISLNHHEYQANGPKYQHKIKHKISINSMILTIVGGMGVFLVANFHRNISAIKIT